MAGKIAVAQNESKKWYFGNQAGLDFMTSPPTILTNGAMTNLEGCASIADPVTGNLLFYTNGITVWDQTHNIMANGTGLLGNGSSTQSGVIVKQPGNTNIYYVFTVDDAAGIDGLRYSVVDMTLASGNGSVTSKNNLIYTPSSERVTAVKHCNGVDIWVISHDYMSTNFRANLVSATGVNTVGVLSSIGTNHSTISTVAGYLKASPNGKKIGIAMFANVGSTFEIYDFDNSTGIVTNSLSLTASQGAYGCEFSPDGTKFYGAKWSNGYDIYQWDLCAGTPTAVVASLYTVTPNNIGTKGALQLGPDGKIYVSMVSSQSLSVINNPNVAGVGCNYVVSGQSISPKTCSYGLPNFITSGLKPPPLPFTHTVSNSYGCQTASYTAPPPVTSYTSLGCSSLGYSLTGMLWNFGDPASGTANTSTLTNPSHAFTSLGTFTTSLIMYYSCGGGTDTIKQVVVINQPCISVSSTSITCASLGSATVQATGGIGPYSYTWMPSGQTTSVATGLSPGTYTLTVFDFGNNFTYTAMTTFNSLIPLSGFEANSPSVNCNGAATGTAAVTGISGGSGSQNYLWTNGVNSYTTPNPQNLTAGNYTFTVTDALTGCIITGGFFISQPPALALSIAASSPSTCAGTAVSFTGTASSGIPFPSGSPYTYSWTSGPVNALYNPVQSVAGTYVYTLVAADSKSCQVAATVSLNVIANPTLNVGSTQICPLQNGTLNAVGATSYTWNNAFAGNPFVASPASTTVYTLTGASQGCTASTTATITLKTVPSPTLTTNSPLCNGTSLLLNGSGGSSYAWSGPLIYSSALQNPTINPVGAGNAGVYSLTVSAANGCTASTSANVVVNPTPTLSATGSTVCVGQMASLTANSLPGASYLWSGPLSYTSALKNSQLNNATLNMSGNYTVLVTSVNGCTNTSSVPLSVVASPTPVLALSANSICAQALSGSSNVLTANFSGALGYTLTAPANIAVSNPGGPFTVLSSIAPFSAGVMSLTLKGTNGVCTVSTSAVFSLVANPVIAVSPPSGLICEGRTYSFTASGASTYSWSPALAGILSYSAGAMVIVSPTLSTLFSVYGSSVGCNSAVQNASLTVNPLPVILPEPLSATICLNSNTLLQAKGTATSWTWSPGIGLNTTTGSSVIAGPLSRQDYTITGSLNTCTSTALVSVFVLPLPVPSYSLSATAVCLNETLTAQGFGGVNYVWTDPIGFSRQGQNISILINNAGYAGTHTLLVTDQQGCKAMRTFLIGVYNAPSGILSGSKMQGCVPFCSDFSFFSTSPSRLLWQVDGKSFAGNSFSYCFNRPGQYRIMGNLQDTLTGCVNVQDFMVSAWSAPRADFEFYPLAPVENLDEVKFINTSQGELQSKWSWNFIANGVYHSDHENPAYTFNEAGTYPVAMVVSNQVGCADTIVKMVRVEPDFNVYVPNAFTPNGDELNELFKPVMRGAQSFNFTVFNRWGEKIYETTDFNAGWDGKFKGQACKQDVYVWKLQVKSSSNPNGNSGTIEKNLSGVVTLYR